MNTDVKEFLHTALDRVEHNSSVAAFYHRFDTIKKLVEASQPELTEAYFASRFVYGLQEDYQQFILRFRPLSVIAAYRLAMIHEESIYLQYCPEACIGKRVSDNEGFAVSPENRFGISFSDMSIQLQDLLHNALDRVEHTSSVEVFYHRFEAIRSLVQSSNPKLPESYFASRFISSLQEDCQNFIIRFQPITVMAAYRLASIFEESLYLDYFPDEIFENNHVVQHDEFSVENIVAGKHLDLPCIDKVCTEVVVDAVSSVSTSSSTHEGSDPVEESAVDTIGGSVAIVSQNPNTLESHIVFTDRRIDIISSNLVRHKGASCLECTIEHMNPIVESFPCGKSVDCSRLLDTQYFHVNWAPELVQVPCINRHTIIYLKLCCLVMKNFSSRYFEESGSTATFAHHRNVDDTVGAVTIDTKFMVSVIPSSYSASKVARILVLSRISCVLLAIRHLHFRWEPGPLGSQWQSDGTGRHSSWAQGSFILVALELDIVKSSGKSRLVYHSPKLHYYGTATASQSSIRHLLAFIGGICSTVPNIILYECYPLHVVVEFYRDVGSGSLYDLIHVLAWLLGEMWPQRRHINQTKRWTSTIFSCSLDHQTHKNEESVLQCFCLAYDGATLVVNLAVYYAYQPSSCRIHENKFQLHWVFKVTRKFTFKDIFFMAAAIDYVFSATHRIEYSSFFVVQRTYMLPHRLERTFSTLQIAKYKLTQLHVLPALPQFAGLVNYLRIIGCFFFTNVVVKLVVGQGIWSFHPGIDCSKISKVRVVRWCITFGKSELTLAAATATYQWVHIHSTFHFTLFEQLTAGSGLNSIVTKVQNKTTFLVLLLEKNSSSYNLFSCSALHLGMAWQRLQQCIGKTVGSKVSTSKPRESVMTLNWFFIKKVLWLLMLVRNTKLFTIYKAYPGFIGFPAGVSVYKLELLQGCEYKLSGWTVWVSVSIHSTSHRLHNVLYGLVYPSKEAAALTGLDIPTITAGTENICSGYPRQLPHAIIRWLCFYRFVLHLRVHWFLHTLENSHSIFIYLGTAYGLLFRQLLLCVVDSTQGQLSVGEFTSGSAHSIRSNLCCALGGSIICMGFTWLCQALSTWTQLPYFPLSSCWMTLHILPHGLVKVIHTNNKTVLNVESVGGTLGIFCLVIPTGVFEFTLYLETCSAHWKLLVQIKIVVMRVTGGTAVTASIIAQMIIKLHSSLLQFSMALTQCCTASTTTTTLPKTFIPVHDAPGELVYSPELFQREFLHG